MRNYLYYRAICAKAFVIILFVNIAFAQKIDTPKPPEASSRKLAAEFTGGAIGSFLGFWVASNYYGLGCTAENNWEGGCTMGAIFTGVIAGIPVGSALGVYAVGSMGDSKGSLLGTALGTVIGMYFGVISGNPYLLMVFPSAGATLGFNLTLRYKKGREPRAGFMAMPYFTMQEKFPKFGVIISIH